MNNVLVNYQGVGGFLRGDQSLWQRSHCWDLIMSVSGNVVEGGFFHAYCCGWPLVKWHATISLVPNVWFYCCYFILFLIALFWLFEVECATLKAPDSYIVVHLVTLFCEPQWLQRIIRLILIFCNRSLQRSEEDGQKGEVVGWQRKRP
jgi:hypothetical protein